MLCFWPHCHHTDSYTHIKIHYICDHLCIWRRMYDTPCWLVNADCSLHGFHHVTYDIISRCYFVPADIGTHTHQCHVKLHSIYRLWSFNHQCVQWNHCLRTYCNKNFRGWIAGFNPFCQLIEIRTLGRPGILVTGSYLMVPLYIWLHVPLWTRRLAPLAAEDGIGRPTAQG